MLPFLKPWRPLSPMWEASRKRRSRELEAFFESGCPFYGVNPLAGAEKTWRFRGAGRAFQKTAVCVVQPTRESNRLLAERSNRFGIGRLASITLTPLRPTMNWSGRSSHLPPFSRGINWPLVLSADRPRKQAQLLREMVSATLPGLRVGSPRLARTCTANAKI